MSDQCIISVLFPNIHQSDMSCCALCLLFTFLPICPVTTQTDCDTKMNRFHATWKEIHHLNQVKDLQRHHAMFRHAMCFNEGAFFLHISNFTSHILHMSRTDFFLCNKSGHTFVVSFLVSV